MIQRKENLPVKDTRSSEERDQEDLDIIAFVSMVRVRSHGSSSPRGSSSLLG